ncbi:Hypothetical protein NTJ_14071 [Nesidiocoris tenuis]|uniref:Uncharacterized protein n=1 Tax=Nesidiocoris tenuis TaxID=355587 RepID=A0ABN7BBP0_9HEMI|nr:Hypothetical protein NTJ_14071 [Nesidiocoris tenuis]
MECVLSVNVRPTRGRLIRTRRLDVYASRVGAVLNLRQEWLECGGGSFDQHRPLPALLPRRHLHLNLAEPARVAPPTPSTGVNRPHFWPEEPLFNRRIA